jgi:prophage DNA circulation protein
MALISQQIRQAENTIRNATDCQSLLFNIEMIVNQTVRQLETSIENSGKLNELYGVLAKIPTSLDEVIKWIKAQVLGAYFQQLKAAIEQVKEAIECANALVDLVKTVEEAVERLPECFAQIPSIVENSVKNSIDSKIQNIVDRCQPFQFPL